MRRRDFVRSVLATGASTALPPSLLSAGTVDEKGGTVYRLDDGWRFIRSDMDSAQSPTLNDSSWDRVMLPHTARIEALLTGEPDTTFRQWQGICWYRRRLRLNADTAGKKVFLKFDGAMNVAEVWLDGAKVGGHLGGYLPFVLDVTEHVKPGSDTVLAVRLDNTDNPVTGPKPLNLLDFNTYHGLYRYVYLIVKDRLHITDPILANRPASGGVFVTYPTVTSHSATVRIQTHIRNDHRSARTCHVRATLSGPGGKAVSSASSRSVTLQSGADASVVQELQVEAPQLWSPRSPNLYTMRVEVVSSGRVVDVDQTRIGIRRIEISRAGFTINGEKLFLRGTNQHQEYPYVGYAVPEAAQYRDARKIKEAGFDYIRLSHYPHAPAFMDACDELGIVVMNSIPGWQYFRKDPAFTELQYQNCRDMIRRDRNRPSVIMWEVSLNETGMPAEFIARTHAIAHEEYPGDQCYTCGWTHGYDVFIQARQHGGCTKEEDHPCVVSEYGDWEYYAMTAGLNQESWERLSPAESNSRQLRWQGERAMLQQASNFQEAHNDNRGTRAFADGLWVMYDYNRGYAPDIESSGCMDIFRLPKYSYWFFRSQRSPGERVANAISGPNVFIATEWTSSSSTDVRVFSNCEEVELRLNGKMIGRRRPDQNRMTEHLAHPPFTFHLQGFVPGKLEAIAFIGGQSVARHEVSTPGAVERLVLSVDFSGAPVAPHAKDVLFCRASLKDADGRVAMDAFENVAFGATAGATLIGSNPCSTDAGIASILVQTESSVPAHSVFALSIVRSGKTARVLGASLALTGSAPAYEVRYTMDGSSPGPASTLYMGPIETSALVRAVLVSRGVVVAALDETARRVRIRANVPPESRDKFRKE